MKEIYLVMKMIDEEFDRNFEPILSADTVEDAQIQFEKWKRENSIARCIYKIQPLQHYSLSIQ